MPSGMKDANGWDGWLECATKFPGPTDRWKQFGFAHTAMTTLVHHSQEGWFRTGQGSYHAFRDPKRFPTAWMATVTLGGEIYQHYPAFARLRTSSGANLAGPGIEMEGFGVRNPRTGKPDLASPKQIEAFRRIHLEIKDHYPDLRLERNAKAKTGDNPIWGLTEHRQFPTKWGGTACPSDRYAPLWEYYEQHGPPEHPKPAPEPAAAPAQVHDPAEANAREQARAHIEQAMAGIHAAETTLGQVLAELRSSQGVLNL